MKYFFYTLCLLYLHGELFAQKAYSTVEIGIDGSWNINKNRFHQFWQVEPVPGLFFITPAPRGYYVVGLSRHVYHGSPSYTAYFPNTGWGMALPVFSFLSWDNRVKIGNYFMLFGDYETNETKNVESELGLTIETGFRISVSEKICIHTSLEYFRIYTRHPIELLFLSTGISYRFDAPAWFRNFLK